LFRSESGDVMRVPARAVVVDCLSPITDLADQEAGDRVSRSAAGIAQARGLIAIKVERVLVVLDGRILLVPKVDAELDALPALDPADAVIDTNAVVDVVAVLLLSPCGRLIRAGENDEREELRIVACNPVGGGGLRSSVRRADVHAVGTVVTQVEVIQQGRGNSVVPPGSRVG